VDTKPYRDALDVTNRDHDALIGKESTGNCAECRDRERLIFWLQQAKHALREILSHIPRVNKAGK